MEQIHLTSLQYHPQEQQSRKPTTSWGPRAVLARLKTGESCELFKGVSCFQNKVVRVHAPRQRHQDTRSRPFPAVPRQAGRQRGAAGMQTKHQQNRKESSARLTKVPTRTAEKKEQQQLYGHVFLGRECKIRIPDCASQKQRAPCSRWNQHLPVTACL